MSIFIKTSKKIWKNVYLNFCMRNLPIHLTKFVFLVQCAVLSHNLQRVDILKLRISHSTEKHIQTNQTLTEEWAFWWEIYPKQSGVLKSPASTSVSAPRVLRFIMHLNISLQWYCSLVTTLINARPEDVNHFTQRPAPLQKMLSTSVSGILYTWSSVYILQWAWILPLTAHCDTCKLIRDCSNRTAKIQGNFLRSRCYHSKDTAWLRNSLSLDLHNRSDLKCQPKVLPLLFALTPLIPALWWKIT